MNSDFYKLKVCTYKEDCTDHLSFPKDTPPATRNDNDLEYNTPSDTLIESTKKLQDLPCPHGQDQIRRGQNDIGSNSSATNARNSIVLHRDIEPFPIFGVQKNDTAIICTGKGYIIWTSKSRDKLLVPIYYCAEADGTILSPNSIQDLYSKTYHGFHLFCDCDNKIGHLQFYNRDGVHHTIFDAYSSNNLWYHDL